ncbi:MAG: putative transport system permease protein [Solirubrobacteraceae bacterium]|nr:putative transport system permease protein [Solirubrobacteraceae bacterium]
MNRIAYRGLRERKARTIFTLIAVVLGVALISGTFVLTDTISKSFDKLVATAGENVDVKVLSRHQGEGFGAPPAPFPASVEARVRGVDGVADAAGAFRQLSVTVANDRGERVGPINGAPTLAFSAVEMRFDPFEYEGRSPRADGEIALSATAAKDAGLKIGDRIRIQGTQKIRPYRLVGTTTFGGAGSTGGAAFVVLTLPEVQKLAGEPGKITDLDVQAQPGVTQAELKQRIRAQVGGSVLVRTGEEDSRQESKDLSQILGYLRMGLLVFGLVALLVGSFVIFNTFTITVAQRTREFGMLRTIGATRKQILRAVVLEALLIGVVGSVLGLFAGIGLAPLLAGLLGLIGFDLPSTALVVGIRTIVVAILLGTVVTLLSSLAPALRATRISPMAAMREGSRDSSKVKRRWALALQSAVVGIGLVLMLVGLFGGLQTSSALTILGVGAVLVFIGVGLLSPLLVGPLAALIGRPLAATGGVAAKIARGNAVRSPGRTAGTAAALMVGVALVAFVAIFVNGFKASFSGAFEEAVTAQFVVFDASGLTPEAVAPAAARLPSVAASANLRVGDGKLESGAAVHLDGLDPRVAAKVVKIDWVDGSDDALRALGPQDAMLEVDFAKKRSLRVGSSFVVLNPQRQPVRLKVRGTYRDRGQFFGDVVIPDATLRERFGAHTVLAAFVASAPGATEDQVRSELAGLLARDFPTLKPQSRQEFIDAQVGQVNSILYVFYALLALSVVIALFGIVNTLALSVYERTRELGLLRAVGATRRQIRQIVRGEAIITAVMGAVLGVGIGVLFGVLVSRPLGNEGFVLALPYATLLVLLVLGALAGSVAAIAPARRASRIDVLDALTHQ